ncbi:MAG: hypothetical protein QOK38_415 [Acidobacteriaceae bacterium]|jgi:hypothetical protein|nr:hypothetical protein [Acidobacteriaceae bacterium]
MKSNGSFATTSSAGILLALMLAAGAAHSFSCIECEVATSYRTAVRVYDEARTWGVIVRWWIDPEYGPAARDQQPSAKPDNVCEMHSAGVDGR